MNNTVIIVSLVRRMGMKNEERSKGIEFQFYNLFLFCERKDRFSMFRTVRRFGWLLADVTRLIETKIIESCEVFGNKERDFLTIFAGENDWILQNEKWFFFVFMCGWCLCGV